MENSIKGLQDSLEFDNDLSKSFKCKDLETSYADISTDSDEENVKK